MLSTTKSNDQTAKGNYNIFINATTGYCQIEGLRTRLSLNFNHLRGGHPMISCHHNLPSGAIEGLQVCIICGAELGLPIARDAAKLELLSEPGVAPISVWPVKLDADTRTNMRLSAIYKRANRRSNLAWLVSAAAVLAAWFAPSLLTFHSGMVNLTISTGILIFPVWVGGLLACLYFGRAAKRASDAYIAELRTQTVKTEAQTAAIKAQTCRVRAATRKSQHARAKHLRYLTPRRTTGLKLAA